MSIVAFDTYKVVKRLRDAGFSEAQAEAVTLAVQEMASIDLTSLSVKQDVRELALRLESRILDVKSDLLKTIIGAVAFNSAVVLGAMFGLAKLLGH